MNKFEKWWYETGSGIRPLENEDREEHTKRVCAQFYNDVTNEALNQQLNIPAVVGRSEQCSGCEDSTGETKLWCCNHCGKRIEDF